MQNHPVHELPREGGAVPHALSSVSGVKAGQPASLGPSLQGSGTVGRTAGAAVHAASLSPERGRGRGGPRGRAACRAAPAAADVLGPLLVGKGFCGGRVGPGSPQEAHLREKGVTSPPPGPARSTARNSPLHRESKRPSRTSGADDLTMSSSGSPGHACSELCGTDRLSTDSRATAPEGSHPRHCAHVSPLRPVPEGHPKSFRGATGGAIGLARTREGVMPTSLVQRGCSTWLLPPSFAPAHQGHLPFRAPGARPSRDAAQHSVCASSSGTNYKARRQARPESKCED